MITELFCYLSVSCTAFLALFGLYYWGLRGTTLHTANRWYLLLLLPLSLVAPILELEVDIVQEVPVETFSYPIKVSEALHLPYRPVLDKENTATFSFIEGAFCLYVLVVAIKLFRLALSVVKIARLVNQSNRTLIGRYVIIRTDLAVSFSFLHWIFLSTNTPEKDEDIVIEHEKLHALFGHTYDLFLAKVYAAVFWFNPFVYSYLKELKSLHEFQVDCRITQQNIPLKTYLNILYNQIQPSSNTVGICHFFNGSILKKRIEMMTKKSSSNKNLLKYLLAIPALALVAMSYQVLPQDIKSNSQTKDLVYHGKSFSFAEVGNRQTGNSNVPQIAPIHQDDLERISSEWGLRIHPIDKTERMHLGIDFIAKEGTAVRSTAEGVIIEATFLEKYGNIIKIDHGGGYQTWYAHLQGFNVKKGDYVGMNQQIGTVGNTGLSKQPHLHYEVLKDGKRVDPKPYISEGC